MRLNTKTRIETLCGIISFVFLLLGVSVRAQHGEEFKTRLSRVPIDPIARATISGSGSVTGELVGTKLSIVGTFEGLGSPATIARLHEGFREGVRGPAVCDLTISKETSGNIEGMIELTAPQVESLRRGQFYIQLSSEKAPDGNLWGWLVRRPK